MQRVCQFLLMCATTSPAHAAEIDCAAMDLAGSGTPVPTDHVPDVVTVWHTVVGSHAPHVMGVMTDTLRATLRDLAESDARLYRGLATELATPAAQPALPAGDIAAAIALLEAHGYTVTRG